MLSKIRMLASGSAAVLIALVLQQANFLGTLSLRGGSKEDTSIPQHPPTPDRQEHSGPDSEATPLTLPPDDKQSKLPRIVRYKIAKQPRTGSKTLHGLLNTHPHIRDTFEPLNNTEAILETMNCPEPCASSEIGRVASPRGLRKPQVQKWRQICQTASTPNATVPTVACGFSINIFTQADPTLHDLPQEAFASSNNHNDNLLIVMSRLNVLEHAFSAPMRKREPGKKLYCNISVIEGKIQRSIVSSHLVLNALTRLTNRPVFVWWYEDFVQRPDELLRHAQDFLGVQVLPLRNFNNTQEASRGKEKGGDLETNIENFQEIRDLVQRIDPNMVPQLASDWGQKADTRKAFREICAKARQRQHPATKIDKVTYHRHLDTYCARDGTVVPVSEIDR